MRKHEVCAQDKTIIASAMAAGLAPGAAADLVIFDPDTITDNATREHGALTSSGIPFVIVNGVAVVRNSEIVEDVFPGRPIRRPLTAEN